MSLKDTFGVGGKIAIPLEDAMYALVSDQGTAMGETALCGRCLTDDKLRADVISMALTAGDWEGRFDGADFHNCTDNDALECTACGRVLS